MADFADLKSGFLAGHSRTVADLTVTAAQRAGIEPEQRLMLQVGALAHDLGRVTVTTAIWDKPAPLSDTEWEAVRLHCYYSERLLAKAAGLARGRAAGRSAPRAPRRHRLPPRVPGRCPAAGGPGARRRRRVTPRCARTRPHRAAFDADAAAWSCGGWRPRRSSIRSGEVDAVPRRGRRPRPAGPAAVAGRPHRPGGRGAAPDRPGPVHPYRGQRTCTWRPRPSTSTCRTSTSRSGSPPGRPRPCSPSRTTCCSPDRPNQAPGELPVRPGPRVPTVAEFRTAIQGGNDNVGRTRFWPSCT